MLGTNLKTALVTGASSGIGMATVRRLRSRGLTVFAAARRRERLERLAEETGAHALELDVSCASEVYSKLRTLDVDILINNAGTGRGIERFLKASLDDIETTIRTNVLGLLHVSRALLPGMVARRRGHVVQLGSIAGLYPIRSPLYGASKAAVHLFSQNLRLELAGTSVRHTELAPGRVRTEFMDAAIDDPDVRLKMGVDIDELTAEDVASAIEYVLDTPPHVDVSFLEILPTQQAIGGLVFRRECVAE